MNSLESFLLAHVRPYGPEKQKFEHTHTWFASNSSAPKTLCIPKERYETFFQLYFDEFNSVPIENILKTPLCITEKIGQVFPMFLDIDLDVKQIKENNWSRQDLDAITQLMIDTINKTMSPYTSSDKLSNIVTERLFYKRHIHWPDLFVNKQIAVHLTKVLQGTMKQSYPTISNWDKVIDSSVFNTGLRMIGCHKGSLAKHDEIKEHQKAFPEEPFSHIYLVRGTLRKEDLTTFSLHRQGQLVNVNSGIQVVQPKVPQAPKDTEAIAKQMASMELTETPKDIPEEIHEYFKKLLAETASGFSISDYTSIGRFAIRINLVPAPCPFRNAMHSRTVNRNQSAVWCQVTPEKIYLRCWKCQEKQPLGVVSVEMCKALFNMTQEELAVLKCIASQTTENITNLIISTLGDKHACVPRTETSFRWFTFMPSHHRWMEDRFIIDDIMNGDGPIQDLIQRAVVSLTKTSGDQANDKGDGEKSEVAKITSGANILKEKLQKWSFVSKEVLPVLGYKLHIYFLKKHGKNFAELLDNNQKLIGFTNGVYDLSTMKFRRGQPSDYISKTTGIPYVPLNKVPKESQEQLLGALQKVFPVKEELNYMLWEIAQCLDGTPTTQRFFMMVGHGSNGKSTIVRLMNTALGDYAGEADVSLFTKQRPSSNSASEDLMALKGKRFVVCNEPNQHDKLYLGTVKWLTGGDRITGRGIYEKQQSFYLQCTIFMLCNYIPQIQASQEDFGTWRRIRPRPLRNRFVEKPERPNDVLADPTINDMIPKWAPVFIALLLNILESKCYLEEPAFFSQARLSLQDRSNHIERFIQDHITQDKETSVATSCIQVYNAFRTYMKNIGTNAMIQFDEFIRKAEQRLGAPERISGSLVWKCDLTAPTNFQ